MNESPINEACNKLMQLTHSHDLHKGFSLHVTFGPNMIFCHKFIAGECMTDVKAIPVPQCIDEVERFNAEVEVFVKEVLRHYSK